MPKKLKSSDFNPEARSKSVITAWKKWLYRFNENIQNTYSPYYILSWPSAMIHHSFLFLLFTSCTHSWVICIFLSHPHVILILVPLFSCFSFVPSDIYMFGVCVCWRESESSFSFFLLFPFSPYEINFSLTASNVGVTINYNALPQGDPKVH